MVSERLYQEITNRRRESRKQTDSGGGVTNANGKLPPAAGATGNGTTVKRQSSF